MRNTTGGQNTAVGVIDTMLNNTTGSNNIGLGFGAGSNLTTGSNNIDIGNVGATAEFNTIRIGTQGTQTGTFIAFGISGSAARDGQQRGGEQRRKAWHRDVVGALQARHPRHARGELWADEASAGDLFVTRTTCKRIRQYGLIAEEVARIYPELVTHGPDGQVETVNYLTLSAMLLNELQKQTRENSGDKPSRSGSCLAQVRRAKRLRRGEQAAPAKSIENCFRGAFGNAGADNAGNRTEIAILQQLSTGKDCVRSCLGPEPPSPTRQGPYVL